MSNRLHPKNNNVLYICLIYEDLPKVVYSLEVYALRNISNRNILLPTKTVHLLFDFHI